MSISLHKRIQILEAIGDFIVSNDVKWEEAVLKSGVRNPWFTPQMVQHAASGISTHFLQSDILRNVAQKYGVTDNMTQKYVGIVNAGNIPLVGFHDFMSAFLMGVPAQIKLSSKDEVLFKSIVAFAEENFVEFKELTTVVDRLEDCDAYIATGGETSSIYFKKYFGSKPHIIRGHRTSVAILDGMETSTDLERLSDDIHLYFGLGCRSVTHIFVPKEYDFQSLLESFKKYENFSEHNKYMNNYDYQLAIYLINGDTYMQRYSTLLVQNDNYSSPVSVVHYSYYEDGKSLRESLDYEKIQCLISTEDVPFGSSQEPSIFDFADGVDTFEFCKEL